MPADAAPLSALPALLRREPALAQVVGATGATLAVAGPARAYAVAGLARLTERRPLVVVTATAAEAERLADDLACYLAPEPGGDPVAGALAGPVVSLPAWETLPFERISPEVSTMGRRLAVLWRLAGEGADRPEVVVAPVRAVLQRLGPWRRVAAPLVVRPGERLDVAEAVAGLAAAGYRREPQVEHRGEMAVRGGIVDVFPSTAGHPVRIDLWGDEVDRLTAFDVADQRSTGPLPAAMVFGCRELVLDEAGRDRAAELVGTEPWGRSQWERLAEGMAFDGMESWLGWVHPRQELVTDLLGPDAEVVLVEPRRVRDRAVEVVEEEAALADALAVTWGARTGGGARTDGGAGAEVGGAGGDFPRLHLPFDRLLSETAAATLSLVGVAGGPEVPSVTVRGFEPVAGDAARLARQVTALVGAGSTVTVCAGTPQGAARLSEVLAAEGVDAPVSASASAGAGARVVVAPVSSGFALPTAGVAVLSEADVTGRRAAHRRARPRARPTDGFFDDLGPGGYVVHRQHGVARYAGMTTRAVAGTTRDYLVLEFRG
ncbi:MAG: CarD family transcriptional regulator, partial [Acidimicrobiales bacterium]